MKDLYVLGIETSCDDTSVAVVKNGKNVLSNIISSQADLHKEFGGVVPEIASRKHLEYIIPTIDKALENAKIELEDIDLVSVTYGPGLVGALLVGLSSAKSLALSLDIPMVGVNHIEGHIAANYIEHDLEFPFICLVVSGGHSHIVKVDEFNKYTILGQTRDDAAGEAFDKVARAIGLGYPGGPLIDKNSIEGDCDSIDFPRVKFKDSYDFSFSGLKTSVLNYLNKMKQNELEINVKDVSASFQKAVVDVLVANTITAAFDNNINTICLAGGVAANSQLRSEMKNLSKLKGIEVYFPKPIYCTDNAAMIACAGYYEFNSGKQDNFSLNAVPGLKLG